LTSPAALFFFLSFTIHTIFLGIIPIHLRLRTRCE
jgi:hypothetical protein